MHNQAVKVTTNLNNLFHGNKLETRGLILVIIYFLTNLSINVRVPPELFIREK